MEPALATPAPILPTYQDLAGLLELSLLSPELAESDVNAGLGTAREFSVAAVVVRPVDVDLAVRQAAGAFQVAAVLDYPHGYSTTTAKTFAVRDLVRRGARAIDTVLNPGKLRSRQFQYLEMELLQIAESCRESGVLLRVHLASQHLDDELKMLACRVCRRAGADAIATNEPQDLPLLQEHARGKLQLKLITPVDDPETLLRHRDSGWARIESSNVHTVLSRWKEQLAAAATPPGETPLPNPAATTAKFSANCSTTCKI